VQGTECVEMQPQKSMNLRHHELFKNFIKMVK